jgi:aliphatic nitrilase
MAGDTYPVVRVAAVQAASVFLDREATTAKACRLIKEAAAKGARFIVFPEGFIPGHCYWYHHHVATSPKAMALANALFRNAVEIPGPEVAALCEAARAAEATVVMGMCEKNPGTLGTMWNTQLFLGPDGSIIGKHRKLMPTVGERLVHAPGFGDSFGAFATPFGPASALICGENTNPLAMFALMAEGTRIHGMAWPAYLGPQARPLREFVAIQSMAFAKMGAAFVVSACGALDEGTLAALEVPAEQAERLRRAENSGGSMIVGPDGQILAGPLEGVEGIVVADCDIGAVINRKMQQDVVGHYNRPDIFQLTVNRAAPALYAVRKDDTPPVPFLPTTPPPPGIAPPAPRLAAPEET